MESPRLQSVVRVFTNHEIVAGGGSHKVELFMLSRHFYWTHSPRIIIAPLAHEVPGRFGQFAGQRLGGDEVARPGRLARKLLG